MGGQCCDTECAGTSDQLRDSRYRRVLWLALIVNAVMFLIEIVAGITAGSSSLQADALDFLGDAGNYGLSLFVFSMALHRRAAAALLKGLVMGGFGIWVVGSTLWHAVSGTLPSAAAMGAIGLLAFFANAAVFALLWSYRKGDSNMRSVWLCTRNDVIGNIAVMLAAAGVFGTGEGWPDFLVAAIMAGLALQGAWIIIAHARADMREKDESDTSSSPALRS